MTDNVNTAVSYYTAMGAKNPSDMERHLHPDVQFFSPIAELSGKQAVLEAAKQLISRFQNVTIRAKFGAGDQTMLAVDILSPQPIGLHRSAVLMTFKEGLIARIELINDPRPFLKQKDEIFK